MNKKEHHSVVLLNHESLTCTESTIHQYCLTVNHYTVIT